VHADPPVEHKAYVHRSGRTARAGKQGTVVTVMTDDQVADVRALTRAAGIRPITTVVDSAQHPVLQQLAGGERRFEAVAIRAAGPASTRTIETAGRSRSGGGNSPRGTADRRRRSRRGSATPRATGTQPATGQAATTNASAGKGPAAARPTTPGNGGGRAHSASDFSRRVRAR